MVAIVYTGEMIPFNQSWLAVEDIGRANATRGLIWLSSTLNGEEQPVFLHEYGRRYGNDTTIFDLSSTSVTQSYEKGDSIEGTVMQLLPANAADVYWGLDTDFAARLADQSASWEHVQNEYLNQVSVDDSWVSAVHYPDNIENHAFYQAYMNADGSFDYAFNILRPEGSLDLPMKMRLTD